MPKAIKVRMDNLWYIIQYGKDMNFNLTDIRDNAKVAFEDGFEFYVVTDGSLEENNVTFTNVYAGDFDVFWNWIGTPENYQFVECERIV